MFRGHVDVEVARGHVLEHHVPEFARCYEPEQLLVLRHRVPVGVEHGRYGLGVVEDAVEARVRDLEARLVVHSVLECLSGPQELDGYDLRDVLRNHLRLPCREAAHGHVVLLVSASLCRLRRCRIDQHLVFRDECRSHILPSHHARAKAALSNQESRQSAVFDGVSESFDSLRT